MHKKVLLMPLKDTYITIYNIHTQRSDLCLLPPLSLLIKLLFIAIGSLLPAHGMCSAFIRLFDLSLLDRGHWQHYALSVTGMLACSMSRRSAEAKAKLDKAI